MQDLTVDNITEAVVAQMAGTGDERLRVVMASLVRHLHAFARDVRLTADEWMEAVKFVTAVGQTCTPARQEVILLSDVLGLSALVNLMGDASATQLGTESSLLGPFYQNDAPDYALGDSIARSAQGRPIRVEGRVLDRDGAPVPGASVQVWQTDGEGVYDLQRDGGATHDMRGNFHADDAGRFHFRSLLPFGYEIPMDGPVGRLVRAQGRHGCRPAHIHFLVGAPGHRELVTALYLGDDPYIDSDTVFGVSRPLIVTPDASGTIRYDFRLAPAEAGGSGRVGADPAETLAAE